MTRWVCMSGLLGLLSGAAAHAGVVINEIYYHAPDDLDEVQWVELYNSGDKPVDLGGWSLANGLKFTIPKGTTLPADGYLVIARKPELVKKYYATSAIGPFEGALSSGKGQIELLDAAGQKIDSARYKDHAPWPVAADGYSSSLERICPSSSGEVAENWASSPLPFYPRPAGTPGKKNLNFSATLPPVIKISSGIPTDIAPDQVLKVEAEVTDVQPPKEVALLYRVITNGMEGPENAVPMTLDGGKYSATIPAQKAGVLVRYRVKAASSAAATRFSPALHDVRPAQAVYVHDKWPEAKIALGYVINIRPAPASRLLGWMTGSDDRQRPLGGSPSQQRPPRGTAAFVYVDPSTHRAQVFDYVNVVMRNNGGGYAIHFNKDQTLNGMSSVSMVFEGNERFLLAENLAYEVYRRAGNAASLSDFVRIFVNGRLTGYHLMIERPNKAFLRRNKLNDEGNLYKIRWFGQGLIGQHAKKTNTREGHDDLIALVGQLERTKGDEQWKVIQENFNVDQVATYFAVNMVLDHWDGYFNNYYTYHDSKGTGKWEIYPWDQDKTWGYFDGVGDDEVFTTLPLTFGMQGDRAPGGEGGGPFGGGGVSWWRMGGVFSRPLLANPHFRQIFLNKVKYIVENVYTEKNFFPLIDATADRIREDAILRGRPQGGAEWATQRLAHDVQSLKNHLIKRREYLLNQAELKNVKPQPAK